MATGGINSQLGREEFLKLLVAKLQNQDPLNPMTDQNFIGELAQLSSLEGMEKLNASFADMLAFQQLAQGSSLIGKTVIYKTADSDTALSGVVEGLVTEGGKLQLQVNGGLVVLADVQGMTA